MKEGVTLENTNNKAKIKKINELLEIEIEIPEFQRPYKWTRKNVSDLLNDLSNAIEDAHKYNDFKYRVGSVLIWNDSGQNIVVDGLQRIITLTLIKYCIDPKYNNSILDKQFDNKITQKNIHDNYDLICEWFSSKPEMKDEFINAFENIAETVVIYTVKIEEAFQLFDSQNNRGKELDPHDLLKAYHLREMIKYPYEMIHAVTKWESIETEQIRLLFKDYLFPIWNWSHGKKTTEFSVKDIDTYKGVSEFSPYHYTFAKRTNKAMPCFQITEPFVAGNDFFEMVDHYCNMLKDLKDMFNDTTEMSSAFRIMGSVANYENGSTGLGHAKNLFYCTLLYYYDKFHYIDELAIRKLFSWAYMIRVDIEKLGYATINNYAVGGDKTSPYSNKIQIFSLIDSARQHTEISNLQIEIKNDMELNDERQFVYKKLIELKGI